MEVQAMRRTPRSLLVALLVLSVGAGTVTATGRSGTDLNVCTNEAKDYYGGIKVYAKDKGKGADRVPCAIGRNGGGSDQRLNKRNERAPGLEDIWNGFHKDIESFELRAAAGCVTRVELSVVRSIGGGETMGTPLVERRLDNIDGTEAETRLYEIPRRKDDKATSVQLSVFCPPELPPETDAGDAAVAQPPVISFTALDQRVEAPEAGIAVAFPDDWAVEVRPIVQAEFISDAVLSGEAPGGGSCEVVVQDGGTWSSIDDWAEQVLETFQDFGAADSTTLRLPVGDAIRIDLEVPEEGFSGASYMLSDGTTFYGLLCRASDPPEDRWLSIAETFEFLPEED
jgi:hypothetical protein